MNKAPKVIYLQWEYPDHEFGVTWCDDQINDEDILYIRQDCAEVCHDCGKVFPKFALDHVDGVGNFCAVCIDGEMANNTQQEEGDHEIN